MWWCRRGNSGGSWLPEEKKGNMWYGRGNSGGSWPPAFPCSLVKLVKNFIVKQFKNSTHKILILSDPAGFFKITL